MRSTGIIGPLVAIALVLGLAPPAAAELAAEKTRQVLTLPEKPGDHWVWVADLVLKRSALFDGDSTRMLGMLDAGYGVSGAHPRLSRERGEIYVQEVVYDRGHRGKRIDLVSIYDAKTLGLLGDVEVPPRSADAAHGLALSALLDGERFFAVFNQNPGSSVSIVDLASRKFVAEIQTPGCALVYPAGPRRFFMLCGDGTAMLITLNDEGGEAGRVKSESFFDSAENPVTEKGVRRGSAWLFTSFDGYLHALDVSGDKPEPREPWSLFTDAERKEGWLIGGQQHLAVHEATGRLYSIVHKGEAGSHKEPGHEVWVYDLEKKERVLRVKVSNLLIPFMNAQLGGGAVSGEKGGMDRFLDMVAGWLLPSPGTDSITVTQDDEPLLFLGHAQLGAVAVYDAGTGEHLRDIGGTGIGGGRMVVP
jgi:methylamine dehydrogenase heavy chain